MVLCHGITRNLTWLPNLQVINVIFNKDHSLHLQRSRMGVYPDSPSHFWTFCLLSLKSNKVDFFSLDLLFQHILGHSRPCDPLPLHLASLFTKTGHWFVSGMMFKRISEQNKWSLCKKIPNDCACRVNTAQAEVLEWPYCPIRNKNGLLFLTSLDIA